MNIGPLAIPVAPLILFASVVVALAVARIIGAGAAAADTPLLKCVLAALVVSRLWFVGHYLPAYSTDWIRILDFRDRGFDPLAGVVAGVAMLLWVLARQARLRRPVIAGAVVGMLCWGTASAAMKLFAPHGTLPQVAFVDLSGHARTLARTGGKPLVVNLWASWCGPCRAEMPILMQAQHDLPGVDFAFVDQGEPAEIVGAFLAGQGLPAGNVMLDPQMALAMSVDVKAFPTTLFYDGSGKLQAVHLGAFSRATLQDALATAYPALPARAGQNEANRVPASRDLP